MELLGRKQIIDLKMQGKKKTEIIALGFAYVTVNLAFRDPDGSKTRARDRAYYTSSSKYRSKKKFANQKRYANNKVALLAKQKRKRSTNQAAVIDNKFCEQVCEECGEKNP